MVCIEKETIAFLKDLHENNCREWFYANKNRYDAARANYETFMQEQLDYLIANDATLKGLELKQCLFRIYQDVRFSRSKVPYKSHFGCYIATKGGRSSNFAGYYFHLGAEESFFGGGIYMPIPGYLKIVRKEIYYQIDEFKAILNNPLFKKYYDGIEPIDQLKRAPAEFPKDFPDLDLLRNRHFFVSHYLKNEIIIKENFSDFVKEGFQIAKSLVDFINFTVTQPFDN